MERIIHELQQGSDAWHQFRLDHFGASEAAAMLGLSKKTSRPELLRMKATGAAKEFSAWVQEHVLDHGHEVEEMARPIAEVILEEDLFPATYSLGRLSASCDGLTMAGTPAFEHKQWAEELAAAVGRDELPEEHQPQCQQVMHVTGAEQLMFMVSDGTPEKCVWMWVYPDQEWVKRIVGGWDQFAEDLANYQPVEVIAPAVAEPTVALPALFVQARGEITTNNLAEFGAATAAYLAGIKTELVTDQDFANAKAAAANCRSAVEALELTKNQMLEQTVTIGEACRQIDKWKEDYRLMALALEKDVKEETENRRVKILNDSKAAYAEYVESLEVETAPIKLAITAPDFVAAMKGKKSIKGWQDAVNAALANGKVAAAASAKDLRGKLAWKNETAAGFEFLFADLAQIIHKADDDFRLLVTSRIAGHRAAEEKRIADDRERIRAEEQARIAKEAEADRLRTEAIAQRILAIKEMPMIATEGTVETVKADIDRLTAIEIDDSFHELQGQASEVKAAALEKLQDIYAAKKLGQADRFAAAPELSDSENTLHDMAVKNSAQQIAEYEAQKRHEPVIAIVPDVPHPQAGKAFDAEAYRLVGEVRALAIRMNVRELGLLLHYGERLLEQREQVAA